MKLYRINSWKMKKVLPLSAYAGNKTEAYNIRQMPALYISSNRAE